MPVTNNNLLMIDRPVWEQLTSAPANAAAAVAMVDDNSRFIYVLFTAASFWQYDTWSDTWMQLPSPPGGTLAAGSCLRYAKGMGGQVNGQVFGSVYALIASGTAVVFYRYDIATATWSGALSVTNVPAAFGTDGRLCYPEPYLNGWAGGYHGSTSLTAVTASAAAAAATAVTVAALGLALPAGAVLNFGGGASVTLTAGANIGATSLTVSALSVALSAGTTLSLNGVVVATITSAAAAGATTVTVNALTVAIPNGSALIYSGVLAVLTAAAAAAATSITVAPLVNAIPASAVAQWYADMYLVGNNATQMYRYNIAGNAWSTTSSNSGNPALAAVTGAPGAGEVLCWLPGSGDANALDRLILVRGGATSTIYEYSMTGNTWSTVTYYPSQETYTTGSSSGVRANPANGKQRMLLMQKDATGRVYEFNHAINRMDPKCTQNLIANGTAVVGDKSTVVRSPDGIEFLYTLINTGAYFLRTPLFF